jgi:hypothetical protein
MGRADLDPVHDAHNRAFVALGHGQNGVAWASVRECHQSASKVGMTDFDDAVAALPNQSAENHEVKPVASGFRVRCVLGMS